MPAYVDFETRSTVDIKKTGAAVYAAHSTTEVLCMAYAIDDGEVKLWKRFSPFPKELLDYISQGNIVSAHNAPFEFAIWNSCLSFRHAIPKLEIEQIECNMAKCYAKSLPGKLEEAALALKLPIKKDMSGHRIMLQLSKPRKAKDGSVIWYEEADYPEKFEALYSYCKTDVEVERKISKILKPLDEIERKTWILDHKINQKGIEVDVHSIHAAVRVIEEEKEYLDAQMQFYTGGKVEGCQSVSQITRWLKEKGVEVESIDKTEIREMLKQDLPGDVLQVVKLRSMAGKSSTAKLNTMLSARGEDNRIREMFQYHGANTGRWAGRRVQLQNLPRPSLKQKQIEEIIKILNNSDHKKTRDIIDLFYAPPLLAVSDCLRSFLIPKHGHKFVVVDWSAIEARTLAWLAGQENILEIFRTSGKIYEHAASIIYKIPVDKVTKEQRFIGKVAILALGYQGGARAFKKMAKVYGIEVDEKFAEDIKNKWRLGNQNIVKYWYALENAAMQAIQNPRLRFKAGEKQREVTYFMQNNFLYCELPSKRIMSYPFATIKEVDWFETKKQQIVYMAVDSMTKKWGESTLYGGLLSENITQAVARDILRDALLNLDKNGFEIVAHCHDEIICEMPVGYGYLEKMKHIMCTSSPWAKDLPLGAEGYESLRYKKD